MQVIAQGELLPVVLAKRQWNVPLAHARNLFMIDNESAREGLVRSFSPVFFSREILLASKLCDAGLQSIDWYARVPTKANWADGPSRLDFAEVLSIGAVHDPIEFPELSSFSGIDVYEALSAQRRR